MLVGQLFQVLEEGLCLMHQVGGNVVMVLGGLALRRAGSIKDFLKLLYQRPGLGLYPQIGKRGLVATPHSPIPPFDFLARNIYE